MAPLKTAKLGLTLAVISGTLMVGVALKIGVAIVLSCAGLAQASLKGGVR